MKVTFSEQALEDYFQWQTMDRKTLKRINELIKSIQRNGFMGGIGKPEVLKGEKSFSRRIDGENRMLYTGDKNQDLYIISLKGHYND